ncbi:MAG: hypothetical protein KA807_00215 [Prolixibacteraceae bacterium]|nr:hypothetical protein [Prolixibacteraceae bacterium]
MRLKNIILISIIVVLFNSCLDKYNDFEMKTDTQLIAPVAFGSFTLGDILSNFTEDSLFQTGNENELVFKFREDEVLELTVNDFFSLPSAIPVVESSETLGLISLKDSTYYELINLKELIDRVKISDEVSNFSDGERHIFPDAQIGAEYSALLTWEIADFNFIREADFNTGNIDFSLKNNFPANCEVEFQVFDNEMNVIQILEFGKKSPGGLNPGESEKYSFSLANKSVKAPIYYKITKLHFFETPDEVIIEMNNGFEITVELTDVLLDQGVFDSFDFKYSSGIKQINMQIADQVEISKAIIESGEILFNIHKRFEPGGILTINLLNLQKDGKPVSFSVELDKSGVIDKVIDISGCELLMAGQNNQLNHFEYFFEYKNEDEEFIKLRSTDSYEYSIVLRGMRFSFIEGYFGNRDVDFSHKGFKFNQEIWNKIQGEVFSNDPVFKVLLTNPIGIPVESNINIKASNTKGQSVDISHKDYLIEYPLNKEESPKYSELEFNSSNSNILDFIKLPPDDSIIFSVGMIFNPNGKPDNKHLNFVSPDDIFRIGMEFEVPILVKGGFFTFYDTLLFSAANMLEKVKRAEMIFRARNDMPLQINLSVIPFDTLTKTTTGRELFVKVLDAAQTDEFGNVTSETVSENKMVIEGVDIENLKKSNSFLLEATILSPSDGEKPAKLKYENGFDLKIILDVTADL